MKQEDDDDDADDDRFFEQVTLQGFDRGVNQTGAVITGDDFDSGRQGGVGFRQFFFYAIDDGGGVHPVAHHNDARDSFAFALPLGDAFADVRSEVDRAQIAHEDGCSVLRYDWHHLQITHGPQIPETPDHVLCAAHFEQASTDFICAGPHFVNHGGKRNTVGAQLVGVEID